MTTAVSEDLQSAYIESDRNLRIRYSKIACVLCFVLIPAGCSLDWFVYPELFWVIFRARLVGVALIAVVFALHFTASARRHVHALGLSWGLLVQATISYMIFISEGAMSPYYAGLNLLFLATAVLVPFTALEAIFVWIATLVMYLTVCLLHDGTALAYNILFNNLYFLSLSGIICIVSSYYLSRRRFEDFRLRHELDGRNKELAHSYEQLSQLDQLKSDFFANISHELRTPLTLILSPVQQLLGGREKLPEEACRTLEVVQQNSLRLLKLINDLLELIRLEDGRSSIERRPLNLAAFVPGIVESVRHLAEAKGLELSAQGVNDKVLVCADAGRLEKVLLNLLINAIKFTPAPGFIRVHWCQKGDTAEVTVKDSGIGIPEKDLPYIFERFRQADSSSTRKYQGSGIGLALASELVQEHEGTLEAFSDIDNGTLLRMTLPILPADSAEDIAVIELGADNDAIAELHGAADRIAPPALASETCTDEPHGAGRFTVLVVEDEPDMRQFLVSVLQDDYRVFQAADGEAALRAVREKRPHLVLLDLMLPGIDGLDVCDRIKGDPKTRAIKVVLLTARTDEAAKLAALERGADDFLLKPFSTAEVSSRLANLMRAAELEDELRARNVELQEALAKLKEAEAQLVQTEKMNALGSLAAGLLHEINNPLNYTLTALQVAQMSVDGEDEEMAEILGDIGEGMTRIRDIVTDLRSFAYPDSDNLQQVFPVSACVDTALRLTAQELSGIEVEWSMMEDVSVRGARTLVTHLLMNLLTNAAQALKETRDRRAPVIRIAARLEGGRVEVRVRDNGAGIAPEHMGQIFDPFFTTRTVGEGMGLGLSICHTIVSRHGGAIMAQSQIGEWTEMVFDLPSALERIEA